MSPAPLAHPWSEEAERAVLSVLLTDEKHAPEALDIVRDPEMFYAGAHRMVFEAVLEVVTRGERIDFTTIVAELRARNRLDAIGGLTWLSGLVNATPAVAHVATHARIIRDRYQARRVAEVCAGAVAEVGSDYGTATELLSRTAQRLADISDASESRMSALGDEGDAVFEEMYEQWDGKRDPWGVRGTIGLLHALTHGYGLGQVIVIASTSGGGKSLFALQESLGIAGTAYGRDENGNPERVGVAYLSFELPRKQIYRRALVRTTHVLGDPSGIRGWTQHELATGRNAVTGERIADGQDNRGFLLEEARKRLRTLPIEVDDQRTDIAGVRLAVLRAQSRLRRRGSRLRLVVLDHLHLLKLPRGAKMREDEAIAEAVAELKSIAVDTNSCVFVLAQYKREAIAAMRAGRRPVMDDLKGASAIEQIADKVLCLHRPWTLDPKRESYDEDTARKKSREAEALLVKHRDGAEGSVALDFLGAHQTFREAT